MTLISDREAIQFILIINFHESCHYNPLASVDCYCNEMFVVAMIEIMLDVMVILKRFVFALF